MAAVAALASAAVPLPAVTAVAVDAVAEVAGTYMGVLRLGRYCAPMIVMAMIHESGETAASRSRVDGAGLRSREAEPGR